MSEDGVHAAHCCKEHGCKYGKPECPVASGEVKQDYPCEECEEGGDVRTIELWKCSKCDHLPGHHQPCIRTNSTRVKCEKKNYQWEPITATIQEQPKPAGPRLEDLKGQEIEVWIGDKRWRTDELLYVDWDGIVWLANANDKIIYEVDNVSLKWRLPLRNRMMRGQPIIAWDEKSKVFTPDYHFFHSINLDGEILVHVLDEIPDSYSNWRMPTAQELKDIGHTNGRDENGNPWLTEG